MIPHYPALTDGYPPMVSLDHAIWFQRASRVLYYTDSPIVASGICLTRGLIDDRAGRLTAGTVQETLEHRAFNRTHIQLL